MSQSESVLITSRADGANIGTFIQRIINEVGRASSEDEDAIKLAMISAMRHFEPLQLWWQESTFTFDLTVNEQEYGEETASTEGLPSDFLAPIAVYILVGGTRWLPLKQDVIDNVRWFTPTSTVVGVPSRWCYWDDKMYLTPIPNEVGTSIRIDYYAAEGIPTYTWDGGEMVFTGSSGETLSNNWFSNWFDKGEELLRARTKWDLYYNYYDDMENAVKQGGMTGDGGAIDTALTGLLRRHNRPKQSVRRQPTYV